jgi:hypothetical protein
MPYNDDELGQEDYTNELRAQVEAHPDAVVEIRSTYGNEDSDPIDILDVRFVPSRDTIVIEVDA